MRPSSADRLQRISGTSAPPIDGSRPPAPAMRGISSSRSTRLLDLDEAEQKRAKNQLRPDREHRDRRNRRAHHLARYERAERGLSPLQNRVNRAADPGHNERRADRERAFEGRDA